MNKRIWIPTLIFVVSMGAVGQSTAQDSSIPLGSPMPAGDVQLADGTGTMSLESMRGTVFTAIVFWGNRCPWTTRYENRIELLDSELDSEGKVILLINSNDAAAFPAESAEATAAYREDKGIPFPYLSDPGSAVATAFGATRTPQAFVFDAAGTLVYKGAVDDSPGDPDNVGKQYLRDALQALSRSEPVAVPETKAFGCMIRPVR